MFEEGMICRVHGELINYGDVPTWIAAVFAAVAAGYAYRAYRVERRRDDRAEDEDRRQQAAFVSTWTATSQPDRYGPIGVINRRVKVSNASPQAIYDVSLWIGWCSHDTQERLFLVATVGTIAPETDSASFPMDDEGWTRYCNDFSARQTQLEAEGQGIALNANPRTHAVAEFTDAWGRRWRRSPTGLTEIDTREVNGSR